MIVIWGEVLFLIDFSMDLCALYFTHKVLGYRICVRRLLLCAGICATLGVFAAAHSAGIRLLAFSAVTAACALTVPRAHRSFSSYSKTAVVFVVLEATIGGIMSAAFSWLNSAFSAMGIAGVPKDGRLRLFYGIAAVMAAVCMLVCRIHMSERSARISGDGATISVWYHGGKTDTRCIIDSGNLLREPISGRAAAVLPSCVMDKLGIDGSVLAAGAVSGSRLIALKTVQGSMLLWGIRPDAVCVRLRDGTEIAADIYILFSENVSEAVVPASICT